MITHVTKLDLPYSTAQKNKPNESSSWDESTSGWNETVATESEVAVKADHSENGDPEILQRKSVEHIRERLHHADDVTSGKVEAEYEREEVQGPLKHAMGNAEVKIEETVEKLKKGLK